MINRWLGLPENAAEHGFLVDHMMDLVHWFMFVLLVGWTCFFLYTLYRFRRKNHPVADYRGVRGHTSTHAEVTVVIIEVLLLLGFAFPFWAKQVNAFPMDQNPVRVRAIGEQFAWSMHYPGPDGNFGAQKIDLVDAANPIGLDRSDPNAADDLVVRNEMHVPVGRPVVVEVSSKDVIHNFGLYSMRVAQDAIPGSEIPLWFKPVKTGEWEIICGQLCGLGHFSMKAQLVVDTAEDYEAWLKQMAELNR